MTGSDANASRAVWLTPPPVEIADSLPPVLPPVPSGVPRRHPSTVTVGNDDAPVVELPSPLAQRHGYRELPLRHTPSRLLLRQPVVQRLVRAQEALPEAFGLLVLDGWRPAHFQAELLGYFGRQHSDGVEGFVSDPSEPGLVAPHTTGGAVDLTLTHHGVPLALGTDWDAFVPSSAVASLEVHDTPRTAEDELARDLRRLLAAALLENGFAPLPAEWWHWSYGDQQWAAFHGLDESLFPEHHAT